MQKHSGFIAGSRYLAAALVTIVVLGASAALVDIISGASSTSPSTDVTTTIVEIDQPDGVAQGDVMIANIAFLGGGPATTTAPAGWTAILRTDNDTSISIVSYWKAAGASEPSQYRWQIAPQTRAMGGITAYRGVDTSNPIDAFSGNIGLGTVATTTPIVTSQDNEVTIALFATDIGKNGNAGAYFSTPAGMTEKYDESNVTLGPSIAADDMIQVVAGNTGSKSSTINDNKNHNWVAQHIALRPKLNVEYLVVAGGGGGGSGGPDGNNSGGGGGGGGVITGTLAVTPQAYNVTVGAGGSSDNNGSNSTFSTVVAIGGGKGGRNLTNSVNTAYNGGDGGSGGGGSYLGNLGGAGVSGQGNGGASGQQNGGGSGGGGGAGAAGTSPASEDPVGGDGIVSSISGSPIYYGGGGGGSKEVAHTIPGGQGGGGYGPQSNSPSTGGNGAANTGGGGGGANGLHAAGGAGGSGIVIIRYPTGSMSATGGAITTSGGYTIHTFTSSGTFTVL